MKYTEGAFQNWGYEVAAEFGDKVTNEGELATRYHGVVPEGTVLLKDRLADNLFQQVLLRPAEYQVIATPNLNGDYISDALAAQVGGLGMAPGANIGDNCAIFEATHGSAPKYAGLDKVNPTSLILSGTMLLEYLGWGEAAAADPPGPAPHHPGRDRHLRPGPAAPRQQGSLLLRLRPGADRAYVKPEFSFPVFRKRLRQGGRIQPCLFDFSLVSWPWW